MTGITSASRKESAMVRTVLVVFTMLASLLDISPAWAGDIRVAVATSIQEAYDELVKLYELKNRNDRIISQYGSSQSLARQIAAGVPVDLFISAHTQWTEYLKINNHLEELFLVSFASNSLVVVGRADRQLTSINDLAAMKNIAVGNPATTAHGQYTMEALVNAGIENQIKPKLLFGKSSHDTLQFAERGEAESAVVYRTEATHLNRAKILYSISPVLHSPVTYQLALTKSGARNKGALDFYKFLNTTSAKAVLEKFGYSVKQ